MIHKLRDSRGLTLVEMLCATIILLLLVLLLNTGFNMAMRSYHSMVLQSETRLLLSTLSNALADELRYADNVETVTSTDHNLKNYQSGRYGDIATQLAVDPVDSGDQVPKVSSPASLVSSDKGQIYAVNSSGASTNQYRLLPDGAYGKDNDRWVCGVKRLEITYQDGQFTVGLTVQEMKKNSGGAWVWGDIKADTEFTVRCLNP